MSDLERALAELDVDWPATPAFDYRRRRRPWLVAAVAVVLVVAAAFAVPQSRGAILRFFHLGGVAIERVDTLPPARDRALRAALGEPITRAAARVLLGRSFAAPGSPLYRSGTNVSTLLPGPVLFTEWRTGNDPMILKKFVGNETEVEGVPLGFPAVWIHGRRHVLESMLPRRLAGNTLIWQRGGITYRLEGRGLTLARATALARQLR
jgi:hypothetical protein